MEEDHTSPSLTYYTYPRNVHLNFIYPPPLGAGADLKTVISLKKNYPTFTFGQEDLSFSAITCEDLDTSKELREVIILDRTDDESTREKLMSIAVPSLSTARIQASYYRDSQDFIEEAKAERGAALLDIQDALYGENVRIFALGNKKSKRIACLLKLALDESNIDSTVMGTSEEDIPVLVNEASVRIEPASITPREDLSRSIFKAFTEYFE